MRHFFLFLSFLALFFSCKAPEARKPVSVSSGSFINESINRNKELSAREEARIQKIIKQDTTHNYITSDGGFWYYYETKDTISNTTAKFGDIVNFNYDIKDLNGDTIYSRKELDTVNYAIDQEDLFFGLREGLKLMKEGETVVFLFPSYQAYGYYGDDHKIGTNIPLVSRVTLNKITKQSTKEN
ncbi:gliding motility-associated peptidyl-prolyl isomerase GldI [Aquimarina litoralis]|uniref:gliding motility-associated peptidyl-prolyl isomerase GldI n=1 Tax=Aquimarina litoralis TaxID=584605 RepID=UPI001C586A94|nr:gliding motility-associated peptidyl-prolyl isomerase GldI [Aquimarina litoralis]MBW1294540.1 gliding motility-associated peptidyl-prolyl isomerase GldI [Aquimarina litoralis]